MEPALSRLANRIADNPSQQARIPQLRGVIDAKMAELADTVVLRDQGKRDEAMQIVHSNLGREVMDLLRDQITGMRNEESRQLQLRQSGLAPSDPKFIPRYRTLNHWRCGDHN